MSKEVFTGCLGRVEDRLSGGRNGGGTGGEQKGKRDAAQTRHGARLSAPPLPFPHVSPCPMSVLSCYSRIANYVSSLGAETQFWCLFGADAQFCIFIFVYDSLSTKGRKVLHMLCDCLVQWCRPAEALSAWSQLGLTVPQCRSAMGRCQLECSRNEHVGVLLPCPFPCPACHQPVQPFNILRPRGEDGATSCSCLGPGILNHTDVLWISIHGNRTRDLIENRKLIVQPIMMLHASADTVQL